MQRRAGRLWRTGDAVDIEAPALLLLELLLLLAAALAESERELREIAATAFIS